MELNLAVIIPIPAVAQEVKEFHKKEIPDYAELYLNLQDFTKKVGEALEDKNYTKAAAYSATLYDLSKEMLTLTSRLHMKEIKHGIF